MIDYFKAHPTLGLVLLIAAVWSLIWKGIALWRAARQGDKTWYVVLFIINSVGILDIFYIFGFSRRISSGNDVTVKPQE